MFAENPLEPRLIHCAIPDAFRVNHEPRPARANPKTPRLRPHRAQARLAHAPLHIFPNALACRRVAAIGPEAEEQMLFSGSKARFREPGGDFGIHRGRLEADGRIANARDHGCQGKRIKTGPDFATATAWKKSCHSEERRTSNFFPGRRWRGNTRSPKLRAASARRN